MSVTNDCVPSARLQKQHNESYGFAINDGLTAVISLSAVDESALEEWRRQRQFTSHYLPAGGNFGELCFI